MSTDRTFFGRIASAILPLCCLVGCSGETAPAGEADPMRIPAHFPAPVYDFGRNPVTPAKVELGRALFYDGRLSRDGSISCGSCHQQQSGFTQHGHDVSHGIEDRLGTRNSQAIQNVAWQRTFFWDGGVHDLDVQPLAPIANPAEMDERFENVLERLRGIAAYRDRMRRTYGDDSVTTPRVLQALAAFMLTLVSAESPYDDVLRGRRSFTAAEGHGHDIFVRDCAPCHAEPLTTDGSFRNTGLHPSSLDDRGRAAITLRPEDAYAFRVPSLRNVEVTGPYMHDGRYRTLEAAVRHYVRNVTDMEHLDSLLRRDGRPGISLTDDDVMNLVAFLQTLTDRTFLNDPRHGEP